MAFKEFHSKVNNTVEDDIEIAERSSVDSPASVHPYSLATLIFVGAFLERYLNDKAIVDEAVADTMESESEEDLGDASALSELFQQAVQAELLNDVSQLVLNEKMPELLNQFSEEVAASEASADTINPPAVNAENTDATFETSNLNLASENFEAIRSELLEILPESLVNTLQNIDLTTASVEERVPFKYVSSSKGVNDFEAKSISDINSDSSSQSNTESAFVESYTDGIARSGGSSISGSPARDDKSVVDDVQIASNEAPTDISLSNTSVAENSAGAVVGTLSVTDPDANDAHSFEISDDRFEVVDGQLTLKEDISLDYDIDASVNLGVTATDAGGLFHNEMFTLNVNDLPQNKFLEPSPLGREEWKALSNSDADSRSDSADNVNDLPQNKFFEPSPLGNEEWKALSNSNAGYGFDFAKIDADGLSDNKMFTPSVNSLPQSKFLEPSPLGREEWKALSNSEADAAEAVSLGVLTPIESLLVPEYGIEPLSDLEPELKLAITTRAEADGGLSVSSTKVPVIDEGDFI